MAIDIKRTENGILIEGKFLFNPTEIEIGIINLLPNIGEEMAYDRGNLLSIDFPGEYDIGGSLIKVYVGQGDKLNFLVTHEDLKFGIIQSPDVLESDEVCDMNYRLFLDESVEKKLDQLEMEGNRINLSKIDEIDFATIENNVDIEEIEINEITTEEESEENSK